MLMKLELHKKNKTFKMKIKLKIINGSWTDDDVDDYIGGDYCDDNEDDGIDYWD